MKLTSEQLKLAQGCTSAEELLGKAKAEGFDLTLAQAESFLDSSAFTELDENSLDNVSGGCNTSAGWACHGRGQTFINEPHKVTETGVRNQLETNYNCDACNAKPNR